MDGQTAQVLVTSHGPMDAGLQPRLVAGRLLDDADRNAVLIHEYLLYRWGITTDEAIQGVLGKTVHINRVVTNGTVNHLSFIGRRDLGLKGSDEQTFTRAVKRLAFLVRFLPIPQDERTLLVRFLNPDPVAAGPPKPTGPLLSADCTIVGVLGEHLQEDRQFNFFTNRMLDEADLVLRAPFALKLAGNDVEMRAFGHETAVILADDQTNVKGLVKAISDKGFSTYSLVEFLDTVRMNVLMITFATSFVAIVALAVAAIGITNTMIMSVLERTHEIGILKALGARTVHLRLLFLVEGAVLGLVGSLLGLGLAYLASIPGDSIAKSIMEPQTNMPVKESLFIFPLWLTLGVPALTTLITTLAAVYPAHRAASVDPITSLRHE
jgi:putative ABC transport system permease protein